MSRSPIHIAVWIGTRPEYIKMAPLVLELQEDARFEVHVVHSGQHATLGKGTGELFGVHPLEMTLQPTDGHLEALEQEIKHQATQWFANQHVDCVLIQGDTATAYCVADVAHHTGVPIGHVEAGLRTYDVSQPFPEEGYRQAISKRAKWHYTPSEQATSNLVTEGVDPSTIHQVGNTIVDAFTMLESRFASQDAAPYPIPYWVMTLHRRESQGEAAHQVTQTLLEYLNGNSSQHLVVIQHPNPSTHPPLETLSGHPQIHLVEPLEYLPFLSLCAGSQGILSDSGGLQEEAPLLGLPILIFREVTERPEVVEAGYGKLVGTNPENIHIGLTWLEELVNPLQKTSLYGLGDTSKAIHNHLCDVFF
ncbi:MAG: UDP-N-acetylglucosamine 2-epimerase (non-hydrolyzing) [Balneolaceae bacterium]|nr:UDP-N-acetylglucosamine 2-epimerase (non-hydrolyzing) [Balneolaceae bacterium]